MTALEGPLLAIESATACLSVALLRPDGAVEARRDEAPGHHAERLLPLVEELLSDAGLRVDDLAGFAVSIGPGSFTSLRVGLATAKGLAFASARPIAAVPTLEALAWGARQENDDRPIAAVLDARRGELYAALFEPAEEDLRCLEPAGLFEPRALAGRLPQPCRIVGEGTGLLAPECAGQELEARWPDAADVARLGAARIAAGESSELDLAPRYVRRAQAEVASTGLAVEDAS